MIKRRNFLRTLGLSFVAIPSKMKAGTTTASSVVKQPEQCDTVFVRENTPITFHLSKSSDSIQAVSLCTEEIQPGGGIPMHKHIHTDEYFYFIAGSGSLIISDKEMPFKPGTSAFVPKNTWHSIKNTGTDKLVMLFGFSPAGFEDFFRQIGTPQGQPFKQKPKEEFDAIAKKFGMVFK